MKKSSFIELEGKDRKKNTPIFDVKVSMENRLTNEPPIEELIEKLDLNHCMNDAVDSIILNKLLSSLNLSYNIPTDSTRFVIQTEKCTTSPMKARCS